MKERGKNKKQTLEIAEMIHKTEEAENKCRQTTEDKG
jgi:hypothetical protein